MRAPPVVEYGARALQRARARLLPAHREQNLLCHHVVAVFVDVAYHFSQRGRGAGEHRLQVIGHLPVTHHARERAAQRPPHAFDRSRGKALGIGGCGGPQAFAAGARVAARQHDAAGLRKIGLQTGAPVAAGRLLGRQRHAARDLQVDQRWLEGNARDTRRHVRDEVHREGVEIHEQRIGRDVVGPPGLVVKIAGIARGDGKRAAVEHDVAIDVPHALALQAPEHQPQALGHELRIALAADVDLALERAVAERALHIDRRLPRVARAQQLQRRVGGHELHHRGGVAHRLAMPGQARVGALHRQHDGGEGVLRHLGLPQRRGDGGGQTVGPGRPGRRGTA